MLLVGQSELAAFRSSPINHANMLVCIGDMMNIEKTRRDQCAGASAGGRRAFAKEFHLESAFLLRFAKRCLLRIFIEFHMPPDGEPFIQLAMMNQQYLALVNKKYCHREINFFVNVRHAG